MSSRKTSPSLCPSFVLQKLFTDASSVFAESDYQLHLCRDGSALQKSWVSDGPEFDFARAKMKCRTYKGRKHPQREWSQPFAAENNHSRNFDASSICVVSPLWFPCRQNLWIDGSHSLQKRLIERRSLTRASRRSDIAVLMLATRGQARMAELVRGDQSCTCV